MSLVQNAVVSTLVNENTGPNSSDEHVTLEQTKLSKLIDMLEQAGIGVDIAPTVSELPDANLFQLLAHINNLQNKDPVPPTKEKSKVIIRA